MIPFFIALGLLSATYHAPATSFISELFPPDNRGRALGLHNTGGGASFLLTPPMALGVAYLFHTWRASFFILALPALLVGIVLWITTEDIQGDIEAPGEKSKSPEIRNSEMDPADKAEKTRVSWSRVIHSLGIVAFLSLTIRLFSAGVRSY
jgi:MFS family permease